MRKQITDVLAFVLIAGLMAGALWVGFSEWKRLTRQHYVAYFREAVDGLHAGSPVRCKGVNIGEINDLRVQYRAQNRTNEVRVLFDVDPQSFTSAVLPGMALLSPDVLRQRVEQGLRARIDLASLFTAQVSLEVEMLDGASAPIYAAGPQDAGIPEIPTEPIGVREAMQSTFLTLGRLGTVDFTGISSDLRALLADVRRATESTAMGKLSRSVEQVLCSLSDVTQMPQAEALVSQLTESSQRLNKVLGDFEELGSIGKGVGPVLQQSRETLQTLQKLTAELHRVLQPNSTFNYQLDSSLYQLSATALSMQRLLEFVERNPGSLIFGRKREQP